MKSVRLLFGISLCLAFPYLSSGQVTLTDSLKLQDFAMPTSPAFSLLDQAPTIIDRPTSARALATGIYQSFDQKTGLPTNYAAELTPFWFFKHPNMSFFKYYGTNAGATRQLAGPQVARASFSVAFVNPANPSAAAATAVNQTASFSYGGRFSLLKVSRKPDLDTLRARTARVVNELKITAGALNAAVPIGLKVTDPAGYNKKVAAFLESERVAANQRPAYKAMKKGVTDILSRKPLASIDLAAASSRYFASRTFSANRSGRTGVWLTGNLTAQFDQNAAKNKKGYVTLYLVGRWLSDHTLADTTQVSGGRYLNINYLDAGGKLELELSSLTFSYELVSRSISGTDKENNPTIGDGWRSVGSIKYKIGPSAYITGAFGKNFGKRDNLLYVLGINWNISTGNEQITTQ